MEKCEGSSGLRHHLWCQNRIYYRQRQLLRQQCLLVNKRRNIDDHRQRRYVQLHGELQRRDRRSGGGNNSLEESVFFQGRHFLRCDQCRRRRLCRKDQHQQHRDQRHCEGYWCGCISRVYELRTASTAEEAGEDHRWGVSRLHRSEFDQ